MVTHTLDTPNFEALLHAKAREIAGLDEATEIVADRPYAQLAPSDATGSLGPSSEVNMGILRDIDYALERIREGRYGVCEDCGKPIREERLLAIPWARKCFACEQLKEQSA